MMQARALQRRLWSCVTWLQLSCKQVSWLASHSTAALALRDAIRQKQPGFHNVLLMAVFQCPTLHAMSSMLYADLPLLLFSNCHIQLACLLQLLCVAQAARHMDVDADLPLVNILKAE